MIKFYTPDHRRVTTCTDFEIKFHDLLSCLQNTEVRLYDNLSQRVDFQIEDMIGFKNIIVPFFSDWLVKTYEYDQSKCSIDSFFNSVSRVSEYYNELFAYYNLYKFLDSATLFIYDITLSDSEELLLRGVKEKNGEYTREAIQKTAYNKIVEQLRERKFLDVSNNKIILTFKGRNAV